MKIFIPLIYISSICAANFSVSYFGPSVTPINAFLLIGLDFVIRDKMHQRIGFSRVMGMVIATGVVSYALNPSSGLIATASASAFILSSLVDASVYQSLIKRSWMVKSNCSNVAASAVDSIVFPAIAFGVLIPWVIAGQFFAKVFGGAVWAWLLRGVK